MPALSYLLGGVHNLQGSEQFKQCVFAIKDGYMHQKHILMWVFSLCIVYNQMYFTGKSKDMVRHIKLSHSKWD